MLVDCCLRQPFFGLRGQKRKRGERVAASQQIYNLSVNRIFEWLDRNGQTLLFLLFSFALLARIESCEAALLDLHISWLFFSFV